MAESERKSSKTTHGSLTKKNNYYVLFINCKIKLCGQIVQLA